MSGEPFKLRDTTHMSLAKWEDQIKGITAGFSTKVGGVSKDHFSSLNLGLHVQDQTSLVLENRDILAKSINSPLNKWVFAEQIHSTYIKKVSTFDCGKGLSSYKDGVANCDGLYTSDKEIVLSLCFADCVPLYFFAPEKPLVGIAHAGWRGTVSDIGGDMVRKWQAIEGIHPKDVKVAIGPSIGSCCYVVDENVITQIDITRINNYSIPFCSVSKGQYKLDLKSLNKYYLMEAGIKEENISISQLCTSCEGELFFSHRRDDGMTGRMLGFIAVK